MVIIRWTKEAEIWLQDIHDYISKNDKKIADSVIRGIYQRVQLLTRFPKMGQKYKNKPEGDIRIILYGHYKIAYITRSEEIVDILGVFHGALDLGRYLL